MGDSYLSIRVDALRQLQNPDGGWGYFQGKKSWLEPTFYSALVLHGSPAADRAWALLTSWQREDGSWQPSAGVQISHAGTALCVTMATVRGEYGEPFRRGVGWLLSTAGTEHNLRDRFLAGLHVIDPDRNLNLKGWPWKTDTSSWVEPTSHALVALKKSAAQIADKELHQRVRLGEEQLLDVRCSDGGWNYGSRAARGEDARSYPETTALALVGLQGRSDLGGPLDLASGMLRETTPPLARAWLTIALRVNGATVEEPLAASKSDDTLVTALEALAAPEGNHRFLQTGAAA